jgi:hypothetical protein
MLHSSSLYRSALEAAGDDERARVASIVEGFMLNVSTVMAPIIDALNDPKLNPTVARELAEGLGGRLKEGTGDGH